MSVSKWLPKIVLVAVLGATLSGCCVVPVAPIGGRYYGSGWARPVGPGYWGGWRH